MKLLLAPLRFLINPKVFLTAILLLIGSNAYAQGCDQTNPNNGLCQQFGFPACYECSPVGTPNDCIPDNTFCDDGNACTLDECVQGFQPIPGNPPINGCSNTSLALAGDPNLPIECYVCEPTENGVVVDNGVCDRAVGEDCASDPDECLVPGETCVFPNSVPPVPVCDNAVPDATPLPWGACEDGDRCTEDLCGFSTPLDDFFCTNPDKGCLPDADGCCPQGCVGPISPATCRQVTGAPIPGCDPDCWPPQDCGDGLVEPPETCDDNANVGDSGVAPDGSAVPDSACRDPGTQNECTYCGDGILDSPSEQCDGTDLGQCTTCSGNCTCGLIPQAGLCIFGGGFGSGQNAPLCGQCSLNKNAVEAPGTGALGMTALAIMLAGLMFRRVRS